MSHDEAIAKVPAITLGFWIIKILATTLGETGGDAVSMSMNLGYLLSTGIFAAIFLVAVLSFSRRIFVKLLGSERQEEWLSGLSGAFEHFGGIPQALLVDNAGPLVVRHDFRRGVVQLTEGFAAFCRD